MQNHIKCVHEGHCRYCDFVEGKNENETITMKEHIRASHIFKCHLCDFQAYSKSHLNVHLKSKVHNPDKTKDHVCDTCGKAYFRLRELKAHKKSAHVEGGEINCHLCGKFVIN